MKKGTTLKMIALSFVPFIMVLGNSMLIPVFTDIKRELQISQYEVGLMISYFSLPAAILIPFLGFLSDRIGRKKILVPSLIIYGLGGMISGVSSILFNEPYKYILFGRVIQGFGAAGTSPIAMVFVSDIFSQGERSKALGIIEASNGIGKVVSPILGSIVALISWYMIFFSYSILTIPIAIGIGYFVHEPKNISERKNLKEYFHEIISLMKNKKVSIFMCLIVGFVSLFVLYGILANLSDIIGEAENNGLVKRGFIVALPLISMSIVSYWFGGYLQKKEGLYKVVTMFGLIICAIAVGIIPYFSKNIYKLITLEMIGISVGAILTTLNTFITSCAPAKKRGVITAFYNSFRFLGISFGPIYFNNFNKSFFKTILLPSIIIIIVILFGLYVKSREMMEFYGMKKDVQ